jgi:hypothetical protein
MVFGLIDVGRKTPTAFRDTFKYPRNGSSTSKGEIAVWGAGQEEDNGLLTDRGERAEWRSDTHEFHKGRGFNERHKEKIRLAHSREETRGDTGFWV